MSKGLDCLHQYMRYGACNHCQYHIDDKCDNKDECCWKTIEKELKALEIIKEKFKIGVLRETCNDDLKVYQLCCPTMRMYISKEEYDLLKEVLKNE